MGSAYTVDFPPPLEAPEAAAELGTGWRVAADMWRAHAPVVADPADRVEVCRVCRTIAPCAMWVFVDRFLAGAEGRSRAEVPAKSATPVVPRFTGTPVAPELLTRPVAASGLPYRQTGRADLPAAYRDERGWLE